MNNNVSLQILTLRETPWSFVQYAEEVWSINTKHPMAEPFESVPAQSEASADDTSALPSLAALAIVADPQLQVALADVGAASAADIDMSLPADAHAYDGHVAVALDLSDLPGLDVVLDGLASSADLFDVPSIDVGGGWDDAGPA